MTFILTSLPLALSPQKADFANNYLHWALWDGEGNCFAYMNITCSPYLPLSSSEIPLLQSMRSHWIARRRKQPHRFHPSLTFNMSPSSWGHKKETASSAWTKAILSSLCHLGMIWYNIANRNMNFVFWTFSCLHPPLRPPLQPQIWSLIENLEVGCSSQVTLFPANLLLVNCFSWGNLHNNLAAGRDERCQRMFSLGQQNVCE